MKEKIIAFAKLLETEQIQSLVKHNVDCEVNIQNARVSIRDGKKFASVNIGYSGRYMVELATGNIYGIKGYGQVHRGHFYGTVDEINNWYWGDYYPQNKVNPIPLGRQSCPALTFAPKI